MIDLKELRRIAMAAASGQWVSWPTGMDRADMRDIQGVLHSHNHTPYVGKNNADHICAFSPATALALLDELERCRTALQAALRTLAAKRKTLELIANHGGSLGDVQAIARNALGGE